MGRDAAQRAQRSFLDNASLVEITARFGAQIIGIARIKSTRNSGMTNCGSSHGPSEGEPSGADTPVREESGSAAEKEKFPLKGRNSAA
jgi:hypothetical protein